MLSKTEHLKLRAIEALNERTERKFIPVGSILPNVTVRTLKHTKRDYTKRATGSEIITELSRLNN